MKVLKSLAIAGVTLVLAGSMTLNTGCGSGNGSKTDSSANKTTTENLLGGGSTFDGPLFSKLFSEYKKNVPGIDVNYQVNGSGAGQKAVIEKLVDFGASDAPLSDDQTKSLSAPVVHIPVTSGAVVVSYNLPDVKDTIKLTADIIAGMFDGDIKKWNDPKIKAINKDVKLPATDIQIVHRADGSGTTNIFTTYLSRASKDWKLGGGNTVNWPTTSLGEKGNDGVAASIKQTPGAVGYVELTYALSNGMPFANVQNKAGTYITPSIASVTAAANVAIPDNGIIMLSNTDAPDGYPISGFSWVIVYKEQKYNNRSLEKATKMVTLLKWMIHDGQQYSAALSYAPLSQKAVDVADAILKSITYDGKPVLQ